MYFSIKIPNIPGDWLIMFRTVSSPATVFVCASWSIMLMISSQGWILLLSASSTSLRANSATQSDILFLTIEEHPSLQTLARSSSNDFFNSVCISAPIEDHDSSHCPVKVRLSKTAASALMPSERFESAAEGTNNCNFWVAAFVKIEIFDLNTDNTNLVRHICLLRAAEPSCLQNLTIQGVD